jgi:hypothetical protein
MYSPGVARRAGAKPVPFCDGCGSAHPWATRQERIYELENLLEEEDIDPADELVVREHLERLRDGEALSEKDQAELWKKVKAAAPKLITGAGKTIVVPLISAVIRRQLGI